MSETFDPKSIELPTLNETFCDAETIEFDDYDGPFRNLLVDPQFRQGKKLMLYSKDLGFR